MALEEICGGEIILGLVWSHITVLKPTWDPQIHKNKNMSSFQIIPNLPYMDRSGI